MNPSIGPIINLTQTCVVVPNGLLAPVPSSLHLICIELNDPNAVGEPGEPPRTSLNVMFPDAAVL